MPKPDKHLGQEALIGQYAHGNEPSHHITWLYAYTAAPQKGQRLREQIVRRFYGTGPQGLVGNDDVGQMSAWLVFAMLGLYPAQPFSAEYLLGEPMLQADIQLPEGRVLRIRGKGPRAHWNGVAQQTPAMTHQELAEGGTLRFSAVEPQRP